MSNLTEGKPAYSDQVAAMLHNFRFGHLPEHLQAVSKPFHDLAISIADRYPLGGHQVMTGLQKLLEAKDCVVRAATE